MKLRSLFVLFLTVVVFAAVSTPAMAGDKVVKRVPAGAVAFHFVGDLAYGAPPELVGYIAFIEGVDGPLFAGEPSKDTAYFTLRITSDMPMPISMPIELDPDLGLSLLPPGMQFKVYFNPDPIARSWSSPDDFEQGDPIAVFEESALLSNSGSEASFNTFSSRLISSTPIEFGGQKINFRKLVPNGVTTTNFGNGARYREYNDTFGSSFGASAIAIGGEPRNEGGDDSDD
jgi:hypothetical protein